MKRFEDCSVEEIRAYHKAEVRKEHTLMRSRFKLRKRNIRLASVDPEHMANQAKIADLTAEIAAHQSMANAFFDRQAAINPPTDAQLKSLKAQLDAVNKLTINRRILKAVVKATTNAANTFKKIQPA